MSTHLTAASWIAANDVFLKRLEGRRVIVTYSGGKDSSVALHFMNAGARKFGYMVEAHGVAFPHHVLTTEERERFCSYWTKQGVPIVWHQVEQSDAVLQEAVDDGFSPCIVCNRIKKKTVLEDFEKSGQEISDLVVVMGYSLWDLVSASLENILEAHFARDAISGAPWGKDVEKRFLETSQRLYPWLALSSGLTIFRPLIHLNDQEILQIVTEKSIPISVTECLYKDFRAKRFFSQYYNKMDLYFDYDKVFNFSRNNLKIPDKKVFESLEENNYIRYAL